jgi:hypothetical protein
MQISILFNNGAKFITNEYKPNAQRKMIDDLCQLIAETNNPDAIAVEKQFAAGKTKYKFPLHRGFRVAVLDGENSFVVADINTAHYLFRGKSFLNDLFPAFLERKLNDARHGRKGCLRNDTFNPSGVLETGLAKDRILDQQAKERKLLNVG